MKRESSSILPSGPPKSPIEVIFFDAAGTLIYLPESVGHHYSLVAARHGLHLDATRLDHAFRAAWKQMPPREVTKMPRPDDDKGWWRILVAEVIKMQEISPEIQAALNFNAYFEDLYQHFAQPGVWQTYPDAFRTLSTLHQP